MTPKALMLLFGVALPLVLVALHAFLPHLSRGGLWLRALAIVIFLLFSMLSMVWLFPPWWAPYLYMLLVGLATVYRAWRGPRPGAGPGRWIEGGIGAVLVVVFSVASWPGITLRTPPEVVIDLAQPLGPGRYLVVSGGPSEALNAHFVTNEAGNPYRGQSFAVDIVGTDALGFYAPGVAPVDPAAYAIHGRQILAPCAGTVAQVHDGMPDMPVPEMDRSRLEGNHVMIRCDGTELFVLLAHMIPGSVSVETGGTVTRGQQVGRVGNSGNSSTPHLHIHVQHGRPAAAPLGGDPVFFTIEGEVLTRNERFVVE
ncbi:M23 family metallopeptidase [Salibaculum sp.]|uniref:M23 family metallopeptidase n=1 Tax=Salibaculum sp. TaxID=2855480 RepID=UPI002B49C765|nr:peptidoglycan DD-metalloendopeptidase family protein [Salibaculum sp.]HKL69056.1 peptidoglycan DD-metalloendopeptidase family protein [Salibaculum sp.]